MQKDLKIGKRQVAMDTLNRSVNANVAVSGERQEARF
jgi:hypothetical protein